MSPFAQFNSDSFGKREQRKERQFFLIL